MMATLAEVREAVAGLPAADGFAVYDDRLRPLAARPPAQVEGAAARLIVLGEPELGIERSIRPPMDSPGPARLRAGQGAYAQAPPGPTTGAVAAAGRPRVAEEPRAADGAPTAPRMSIV